MNFLGNICLQAHNKPNSTSLSSHHYHLTTIPSKSRPPTVSIHLESLWLPRTSTHPCLARSQIHFCSFLLTLDYKVAMRSETTIKRSTNAILIHEFNEDGHQLRLSRHVPEIQFPLRPKCCKTISRHAEGRPRSNTRCCTVY